MKESYFDRVTDVCIRANRSALRHCKSGVTGSAKAWDNKKRKTGKTCRPRGVAYTRMCQIERTAYFGRLKSTTMRHIAELRQVQSV